MVRKRIVSKYMHNNLFGQSVFDYLVILVPELTDRLNPKDFVDPKAAKGLYTIWKDEQHKINNRLFQQPVTVSNEEISVMEKAGLVKNIGNKIEITDKGAEVIRVMILGDNKSIFEEKEGSIIDYQKALATTKEPDLRTANRSIRTASKQHEEQWWDRFLN
jgi:hypothetical protein